MKKRSRLAAVVSSLLAFSLLTSCLNMADPDSSSTSEGPKSESLTPETSEYDMSTTDIGQPSASSEASSESDETSHESDKASETSQSESTNETTILEMEETVFPLIVEAETGEISGAKVETAVHGFSGDGYVGVFENTGDQVTVEIAISQAATYDLTIGYYLPTESGRKINTILINDEYYTSHEFSAGDQFQESLVGPIVLGRGYHTISFLKAENDWGWMNVDYFKIEENEDEAMTYDVEEQLIDPLATPETVRLYDYLRSIYGSQVLSGQQLYFSDEAEITRLEALVGEKPAMKGYDFINQTAGGAYDDQVTRAIDWVLTEGGILSMCWHWWAPSGGRAFYTADTSFDIREAVQEGTDEYELIIRDIDRIATLLLDMQEKGIPVIWRPLHEASGGWFWWGAHGPEPYKALWDILYDRLVHHHGVHNLIWVANGQHPDWYVGDDKADIIGEDIYPGERVYSAHLTRFKEAYDTVGGRKIVALTENGPLPDLEEMKASGAMWAWFMPWWGDFTTTDRYTEDEVFKSVYADEAVINLDDLPEDLYG